MKHYVYQMYDESLDSYTLTTVLSSTKEQTAYSCKCMAKKQPEKCIDKVDCTLFIVGEVDVETGIITLTERELVFDYRPVVKAYLESISKVEVSEDGQEASC